MTIKRIILSFIILISSLSAIAGGIGTWKSYLSYANIQWVEQGGNRLYVLASNALYTYNKTDQSIQTYDRQNGLSSIDIRYIGWNEVAKRLVIVYEDGNIDLLDAKGNVTNVPDYYLKALTADKTVYNIDMNGAYCYLSTGFGLVKLNVAKAEISDSYNLSFPVNYSYIDGSYIYAASQSNGLYRAPLTANLLDKNNWTRVGGYVERPKTMDANLLNQAKTLSPGGPKYNYFGFMKFYKNKLYTCGGGWNNIDLNRKGTIQVLSGNEWIIYEDNLQLKTGYDYVDLVALDIDPLDEEHVFACGRTGIYEFHDGKFIKSYSNDNTNGCLYTASSVPNNNKNYVICSALKFDNSGNLWVFNSKSPSSTLLTYKKSKEWVNVHDSQFMYNTSRSLDNIVSMFIDSRNNLWFVNNHYRIPSAFAYHLKDKKITAFKTFTNEDGITLTLSDGISCIAEDLEKNIWFGTSNGPLILPSSSISNSNPQFIQFKVPRNDGSNLADYLLSDINITSMAIDGAGRKWFGTKGNGVYLISGDNTRQIHHFLNSNSSLLSNNIESIAINDNTGEVFFGTDQGLCSYMSDATRTTETMNEDITYAYPNPVPPNYAGPITIVGLKLNTDVKIVTTNGTLVAQGISNGGTFIWNGEDKEGRRVTSGIYMVEATTEDGNSGFICKVAIIN